MEKPDERSGSRVVEQLLLPSIMFRKVSGFALSEQLKSNGKFQQRSFRELSKLNGTICSSKELEPHHENPFKADFFLQSYLKRILPSEVLNSITKDLERFGERCITDILKLSQECEANPPYLERTNAWGRKVDNLVTCQAWKTQKEIVATEGLVAIPYEQVDGEYSRIYQMSKLMLYNPVSGLFWCPLAMTDAAAYTIKTKNMDLQNAFSRLTTRNPTKFWTSGQWMTEKNGGSDVRGGTETVAYHQKDDQYKLYGYKWFSSACDSDMTMALGRIGSSSVEDTMRSSTVSMFYIETRRPNGNLNNVEITKLKNKLGTRQLPTAELVLDGTDARLISSVGQGVSSISSMLTISRLHNIAASVGYMRKITTLARDFATRRKAFGKLISEHPLHIQTLAKMEVCLCDISTLPSKRNY